MMPLSRTQGNIESDASLEQDIFLRNIGYFISKAKTIVPRNIESVDLYASGGWNIKFLEQSQDRAFPCTGRTNQSTELSRMNAERE